MSLSPVPRTVRQLYAAILTGFGIVVTTATPARADFVIDLTKNNTKSGTDGTALYQRTDLQPTGTGVIDPFVRIQMTGTEKGYNTDGPAQFNTKDAGGTNWDHSVLVSSLQAVTINGTQYYQFLLDVNEQGNPSGQLISMNSLQVVLGNSGSLTGWNTTSGGFGSNSVPIYSLDGGAGGNGTVNLNYKFASGSGSGDLFVYIPKALFDPYAGSQFQYLYLYSAFGNPYASDAGFEEWATFQSLGGSPPPPPPPPPPGAVPAPPSVVLAGLALGGMAFRRVFRRKPTA
jgi:hypothetical protein